MDNLERSSIQTSPIVKSSNKTPKSWQQVYRTSATLLFYLSGTIMTVIICTLQTWQSTINMACLHVMNNNKYIAICFFKRKNYLIPDWGGFSKCCVKIIRMSERKWKKHPECSVSITKLQKLGNYENIKFKTYPFFVHFTNKKSFILLGFVRLTLHKSKPYNYCTYRCWDLSGVRACFTALTPDRFQ